MSTDDFNNKMKEVTVGVTGLIPEVGGVISFMITQFWPDSSENIFDSIKDQIKDLINQAILNKEIEYIEGDLEALHTHLDHCETSVKNQKMTAFEVAYSKAEEIKIRIARSSNKIHLIRYMVALSYLHLGILRETLNYGTEIFQQEKNPNWELYLKKAYDEYYQFFNDIFTDWLRWRVSQIEVDSYITKYGHTGYNNNCNVIDHLTGENRKFQDFVNNKEVNNKISQHLGNCFAERIRNEAILEMAGVLLSTFALNRFLPGRENEAPIVNDHLKVLHWGPYGSFIDPKLVDEPGKITEIRIRAGSWIDGFQFIYADHEGHFIGNPTGGTPYSIASSDTSPVRGIKMRFSPSPNDLSEFDLITQLEFIYSDSDGKNKKTIGPFGNQMGWGGTDYDSTSMIDPEYCLRGGSFGENFALGSIKENFCITAIRLEYHHSSLPIDRSLAPYWSSWRDFKGHFSELATAVMRNGWVEVYAIGTGNNNSLYHRQTTPGDKWSSEWGSLGGHFSELATVVMGNGCVEIFAIGTGENNGMYHIWENLDGTWSKWTSLFDGHHFSKLATAVIKPDGFIEVFAIGAGEDNRIYHIWKNPNGAWMSGTNLFEGHFSKLATAVKPDGSIEVFAIGAGEDNRIYHIGKTPGGAWSSWECLGGHFSELATAVNADGRVEVFAIGTGENNGLYHIWQTTPGSTWSSWECLGGHFSEFATTVNADGRIEVFAIGTGENNGLYHIWQTTPGSTWSSWECINDGHFSKLATAVSADRIEVFVIGVGDNNGVSHIWRPNYR